MRKAIVIDASVAVKWILDEQGSDEARDLLVADSKEATVLLAPSLLLLEVQYAVAKRYRNKQASEGQLQGTFPALMRIFRAFAPLDLSLAEAAAHISSKAGPLGNAVSRPFSVYDSIYIALAVAHQATLRTADHTQASVASEFNVAALIIS